MKTGPAPAAAEPVVGDTYSAYRGHVDFRLYLERPPGWRENLQFALRYNGCPVGATGALRMTVYHARVLQNGGFTGRVVATRKRYSRPLTLWKRSGGGLYRVPVLSQTYYVLRVVSSPACHWEFAGEPAD